jgi:putative membrane protein
MKRTLSALTARTPLVIVAGLGLSVALAAGTGCSDTSTRSGRADASNPDSVRVYNDNARNAGSRYATNTTPPDQRYNSNGTPYGTSNSNNSDPYSSAQTASERMGMGKLSPADKMFLISLGASNRSEIAAAQLALDKSQNPQVQQYARQMITDHRQAERQLQNLAKQKGVDIDAEIPQDARSASYELGKLSGSNFDRQYFAVNHAAHLTTVAAVQHAARYADDPDVRSLAQQLLPTLQQHTNMAGQNIGHDMSGGMNDGTNSSYNNGTNNSSRDVTSPDYRNAPNMNNPDLNPSNGNSPNNPHRKPGAINQ